MLPALADAASGLPVTVIGCYRSDELPRHHRLRVVRAQLRRSRQLTEIELGPLGDEDVRGMLRAAAAAGREMEIMLLVAQGNTSRQIGQALSISPRTVEMHVQGSLLKLQCRTRAEAVGRLAELGTLPQPEGAGRRLSL